MISGDIIDFCSLGCHPEYFLDDFEVIHGEIFFPEFPHVNNIAIQDKNLRLDGFEIAMQFTGMAPIGAQVDIRNGGHT